MRLSWARAALAAAGIERCVLDVPRHAVEGALGVFPLCRAAAEDDVVSAPLLVERALAELDADGPREGG